MLDTLRLELCREELLSNLWIIWLSFVNKNVVPAANGTSHLASEALIRAGLVHIGFWSLNNCRANPFEKRSSLAGSFKGFSSKFVTGDSCLELSAGAAGNDCAPKEDEKKKKIRNTLVTKRLVDRSNMKHSLL